MSNYFFRNKIHLAICSSLGVVAWSVYFGYKLNGLCVLVVFLLTFSIYQYNRLSDDVEDSENEKENLQNARRHAFLITYIFFWFTSLACLVIAACYGWATFFTTLFIEAVGFLYNEKCFPDFLSSRLGGSRRLKDLYIIKNLAPPLDWATATIILPTLFAGEAFTLKMWVCWIYIFTSAFFIEVMWDIRDRKGDLISGIKTIANSISIYRTKLFLIVSSSLSGGMVLYATLSGIIPHSSYFLLSNNIAVMWIASSYSGEASRAMRLLSDMTIVLAILLFVTFGLVAYFVR